MSSLLGNLRRSEVPEVALGLWSQRVELARSDLVPPSRFDSLGTVAGTGFVGRAPRRQIVQKSFTSPSTPQPPLPQSTSGGRLVFSGASKRRSDHRSRRRWQKNDNNQSNNKIAGALPRLLTAPAEECLHVQFPEPPDPFTCQTAK